MSSASVAERWLPPPRVPVLDGVYPSVIGLLCERRSRVGCVPGHQELLRHEVVEHAALVGAIAYRDRAVVDTPASLHDGDLVRADTRDPFPQVPCDR